MDDKEDDSATCHSKRTKAFLNCWMGAYNQTVYWCDIDEIDSDNVVLLTVHFKYTQSDLSSFISFLTAFFPSKNTTTCLTIHDIHSPEHPIKFVSLSGITSGGGWHPSTMCMWISLSTVNDMIPIRCYLICPVAYVMLRRTSIGNLYLFAYCWRNEKSNPPLFVIAVM